MARTGRPHIKGETAHSKPHERFDGELYEPPEPNPFTGSWNVGYDDGFEGRGCNPEQYDWTKVDVDRYKDGFETGQEERRGLDRAGSSNT